MRKNTEKVIRAWESDRPERSSASIWTDGRNIWSYETCILAAIEEGGAIMNVTRYSATTKLQQNAIRLELRDYIKQVVDNLPRGIDARELAGMVIYAKAGKVRA